MAPKIQFNSEYFLSIHMYWFNQDFYKCVRRVASCQMYDDSVT